MGDAGELPGYRPDFLVAGGLNRPLFRCDQDQLIGAPEEGCLNEACSLVFRFGQSNGEGAPTAGEDTVDAFYDFGYISY